MTSVRLTPKMLDLLTYAAECGQATCYVGSDYWRTARALERHGLAKLSYTYTTQWEVALTETGKDRARATREHSAR